MFESSLNNPEQIIPDYTTGISKAFGTYTAEYDGVLIGFVERNVQSQNARLGIKINGTYFYFSSAWYNRIPIFLPVKIGDEYTIEDGGYISSYSVNFYKLK